MKKMGIILLVVGLVLCIASFAVQGIVNANVQSFLQDNNLGSWLGLSSMKLSPADVQPLVKNASALNDLKTMLGFFGMSSSEISTLVLALQAFAATPTMLLVGGIAAALGIVLTLVGVLKGRNRRNTNNTQYQYNNSGYDYGF